MVSKLFHGKVKKIGAYSKEYAHFNNIKDRYFIVITDSEGNNFRVTVKDIAKDN